LNAPALLEGYVPLADVPYRWGITRGTVWRWEKDGRLPPPAVVRYARRTYVLEAALDAVVRQQAGL